MANGNIWRTPSGSLVTSAMGLPMAGASAGISLTNLLPIFLALLPDLFSGGDKEAEEFERARRMQNLMRQLGFKQPYQSPYTGTIDRIIMNMLTQGLAKRGNWGWPAGQQLDLSFLTDLNLPSAGGGARRRLT